jgi:hypothetical protein
MATNIQIAEALIRLSPEAKWILSGDNFDDIEWLCECAKPTKAAVIAEIAKEPEIAEAKAAAKESRRQKLLALGLTEEELDA